jgi:hypothetical protein
LYNGRRSITKKNRGYICCIFNNKNGSWRVSENSKRPVFIEPMPAEYTIRENEGR